MRRCWSGWLALVARREHGTTLALLRIAIACVMLYSLVSMVVGDVRDVMLVDAADGGYRSLGGGRWLMRLLGGPRLEVVQALWWIALAGGVALAVGWGGRLSAGISLLAYHALLGGNGDASGGSDSMITNGLWLLVLGDATATLSLDCRRKHGRLTSDVLVAAWPRALVVFQLVVVYTSTGLHKLSIDWVPGGGNAALYWVAQDPTWNRFDLRDAAATGFAVTQFLSAVTWWWEVTAPLLLVVMWARAFRSGSGRVRSAVNRFDLRWPFVLLGVSMHLGILVLLDVGPFSPIALAFYICLVSPNEWRAAYARLVRDRTNAA